MRKNMRPKNHTNCFDSTFSSSILFVFSSFKTCWNAWSFGLEFFARRFLLFYVNLIATYYQFDVQSILYVNTHTHMNCVHIIEIHWILINKIHTRECMCVFIVLDLFERSRKWRFDESVAISMLECKLMNFLGSSFFHSFIQFSIAAMVMLCFFFVAAVDGITWLYWPYLTPHKGVRKSKPILFLLCCFRFILFVFVLVLVLKLEFCKKNFQKIAFRTQRNSVLNWNYESQHNKSIHSFQESNIQGLVKWKENSLSPRKWFHILFFLGYFVFHSNWRAIKIFKILQNVDRISETG